jgi:hypothetical protein
LYAAVPLLIAPVPSVVLPSLNVTVPVAVAGVTVAVKIAVDPYADGFVVEFSVTVVLAWLTVCVTVAGVLPLKFASPP